MKLFKCAFFLEAAPYLEPLWKLEPFKCGTFMWKLQNLWNLEPRTCGAIIMLVWNQCGTWYPWSAWNLNLFCIKISAHRPKPALGRASGAVAFALAISAKTSYSYSSAGGPFDSSRARPRFAVPAMGIIFFGDVYLNDFWLRFGFPAMGISVLEEILFLELIPLRLEGHGGERFGGIVWGGRWCRWPYLTPDGANIAF